MATTYHEATKPTPAPVAVIATGTVYDHYLRAARTNLSNMVRLAQGLRDAEFEREAQLILDTFDAAAEDAFALIEDANANAAALDTEGDDFWRESIHAERAGMAQ